MKPAYALLAPAVLLSGTIGLGQSMCPVTDHGAKGDCRTDDTAAFQETADSCGSFFIPRPPGHGQCYRVNGVRLEAGTTVTFEDRHAEVWPTTPRTPYIFSIAGDSMRRRAAYTTIRNGMLWAPYPMSAGSAGIRIDYGDHIRVEDTVINGFYDNIFADNTDYLYLVRVTASGGLHANVWHQQSDVHHGEYFGGPLYIENATLDSCECSAASIWVQDIAVVNVSDSDIVGVRRGMGFHADSSNGLPGTPPDYPAGIHIHGSTFDSIGGQAVYVRNYIKSDIEGSWISGGRTSLAPCLVLGDNVKDFSIAETHAYWCGSDGLDIGHAANVVVANSTFSASPGAGIHNRFATGSFFSGNRCDAQTLHGNGATVQSFCIVEEPTAENNTYSRNDGSGTRNGNALHGRKTVNLTH